MSLPFSFLITRAHARIDGIRFGEDGEGAANQQNERNHVSRRLDAAGGGHQNSAQALAHIVALGVHLRNLLIGACHGNFTLAGRRLHHRPLELAGRNDPCQNREQDNKQERDGIDMGQLKFFLLFQHEIPSLKGFPPKGP